MPTASPLVCLIPCAGHGQRAQTAEPKQYVPLAGVPLVVHTVRALLKVPSLTQLLVVTSPGDDRWPGLRERYGLETPRLAVRDVGGDTRARSVRAGLEALLAAGWAPDTWVLVHDAARCLIDPEDVLRLIAACQDDPVGGLLARKMPDTVKQAQAMQGVERVTQTLDRDTLWQAQTPQMFRLGALARAYDQVGEGATDEASAMEATGAQPRLVPAQGLNLKLTYPQDLAWAQAWLSQPPHEGRS